MAGLKIHVKTDNTGLLDIPQTDEIAKHTAEILQKDMEQHHVFWNERGYHNHILHHILAMYGTGVQDTVNLDKAYAGNTSYQKPAPPVKREVVSVLSSSDSLEVIKPHLGIHDNYTSYLAYYGDELRRLGGIEAMLQEHVFSGSPRAEDLQQRLFAGLLHPAIQLMYGVEFGIETVVAQALAQASAHQNLVGEYLAAATRSSADAGGELAGTMGTIEALYTAVRSDPVLAGVATADEDDNTTVVVSKARPSLLAIAGRVAVGEAELETRTWEMYENALAALFGSATVQPEKKPKLDFFLMHLVTASPLFATMLLRCSQIPATVRCRLLESKIRIDLLLYTVSAAPKLNFDHLAASPAGDCSRLSERSVRDAFETLHRIPDDDGHILKLIRATEVFRKLAGQQHRTTGRFDDTGVWDRIYALILAATTGLKGNEPKWLRTIGLEEAWKDVPDER